MVSTIHLKIESTQKAIVSITRKFYIDKKADKE